MTGPPSRTGEPSPPRPERIPLAFISNYQELGYYKNDKLIVLGPKKRADSFSIDPHTFDAKPATMDDRLLNEAVAYYQSAFHAFKRGEMKLR